MVEPAKPILLSATSARQQQARSRRYSASLRVSEAIWMPRRSERVTPDPRYANVSTIWAYARRGIFRSDPILPTWGIVTDMNEFRLYWYDRAINSRCDFTIQPRPIFSKERVCLRRLRGSSVRPVSVPQGVSSGNAAYARRQCPLARVLSGSNDFATGTGKRDSMTNTGNSANSSTPTLLEKNPGRHATLSWDERTARQACAENSRPLHLYLLLRGYGTGACLSAAVSPQFPYRARSNDPYYDAEGTTIWQDLLRLFHAMNEGKAFGGKALNQFNGGLFAPDADLEKLHVPNSIFCQHIRDRTRQASIRTKKRPFTCAPPIISRRMGAGSLKTTGRRR